MEKAAAQLKKLRKSAAPRLTVRAMADALDMPLGTYARYESVYDYKKNHLPIDFTRKVAGVLANHGVDSAQVMKLAGLSDSEAEPEAQAIEAARPPIHFVSLPVALPSEAALADMFESLLALVPPDASRSEAAKILAQRLPSGFAAIGPVVIEPGMAQAPAAAPVPPAGAEDQSTPARSSRS